MQRKRETEVDDCAREQGKASGVLRADRCDQIEAATKHGDKKSGHGQIRALQLPWLSTHVVLRAAVTGVRKVKRSLARARRGGRGVHGGRRPEWGCFTLAVSGQASLREDAASVVVHRRVA